MSDTVNLEWIGATLRSIQAEQRSARDENALIRSALNEAIALLLRRIANFEASVEIRMDHMETVLEARMDRLEARMDSIEAGLGTLIQTVNRIDGKLA